MRDHDASVTVTREGIYWMRMQVCEGRGRLRRSSCQQVRILEICTKRFILFIIFKLFLKPVQFWWVEWRKRGQDLWKHIP